MSSWSAAGGCRLRPGSATAMGRSGLAQISRWSTSNATHVWKPLLHEVAAGRMDADAHDLDYLAIAHWHHFRFRQGAICGPRSRAPRDHAGRGDLDADGEEILPRRALPYDTLVHLRRQREQRFRRSRRGAASDLPRYARAMPSASIAGCCAACVRADGRAAAGAPAHVDIVIIGAGATGVELAAEIRADHPRARRLRSRSSQSRAATSG